MGNKQSNKTVVSHNLQPHTMANEKNDKLNERNKIQSVINVIKKDIKNEPSNSQMKKYLKQSLKTQKKKIKVIEKELGRIKKKLAQTSDSVVPMTTSSSEDNVIIPPEEDDHEPPVKDDRPFGVISELNHKERELNYRNHIEMNALRDTVRPDFKVYPVIVRANGREKKVLAVENKYGFRDNVQLSPILMEELGMTDKQVTKYSVVSSSETIVTISSLDGKQTIPVDGQEFSKHAFYTSTPSIRSYYHNETERWWPHLFGPGQLSRNEETVHVQLTSAMAKALKCSALTTAEFYNKLPGCRVCVNDHPANHSYGDVPIEKPPPRTGKTTSPDTDYYWLMDKITYNTILHCTDRPHTIIRAYKKRMAKRDNLIGSRKYLEIAKGNHSPLWDFLCGCLS